MENILDHHDPDCNYTLESLYRRMDYNDMLFEESLRKKELSE